VDCIFKDHIILGLQMVQWAVAKSGNSLLWWYIMYMITTSQKYDKE